MQHDAVSSALTGALAVLNIVLTLGIIRRQREHTVMLSRALDGASPAPVMLGSGATVGDFLVTTVDDEPLSNADLQGVTLVGFLSPSCPACAESLPSFVERTHSMPGGREQTLAVVVGTSRDAAQLCGTLARFARVVNDREGGLLVRAFGVVGFPAFAVLDGAKVVASHHDISAMPEAIPT